MLADILRVHSSFSASETDREFIERAYAFSEKAHAGQQRKSGEPFFLHLESVALIVAGFNLDATAIAAALLHDTIEDTDVTEEQLQDAFGSDVAFIVQGVTKVQGSPDETIAKFKVAMASDVRTGYVKVADRTHNMRTLHHLAPEKRVRIARETAEYYVPLARDLKLQALAEELEGLAGMYLD